VRPGQGPGQVDDEQPVERLRGIGLHVISYFPIRGLVAQWTSQ
jgi:hypothetical protein